MPNWFSNFFKPKPSPAVNPGYKFADSSKYSTNLKGFEKWTNVINRHQGHMQNASQIKQSNQRFKEWLDFIGSINTASRKEAIEKIHQWINKTGYVPDYKNWNATDHWAAPAEFFANGGDCEDYAAAKYFSLKTCGIPVEDLRLVILNDEHTHELHAVLAVYDNDNCYILDNRKKQILTPGDVPHFKTIYSINEKGWWRLG